MGATKVDYMYFLLHGDDIKISLIIYHVYGPFFSKNCGSSQYIAQQVEEFLCSG